MNFIERLEELISEKHITKAQFLKECGFGGNSFSNWKNSKTGYPTEVYLTKIANYFDVSVEYLKGKTDDRGQKKSPAQMDGAGVDDELRRIWDDSTEAERKAIVSFYETIRGLRGKTE